MTTECQGREKIHTQQVADSLCGTEKGVFQVDCLFYMIASNTSEI